MSLRIFQGAEGTYRELDVETQFGPAKGSLVGAEAVDDQRQVIVKLPQPEDTAAASANWDLRLDLFARLRSLGEPLRSLVGVPVDVLASEHGQVIPWYRASSLHQSLRSYQPNRRHRIWLAYQLAMAAEILERLGTCHGDLSMGNVLIEEDADDPRLRLIDFDDAFPRDRKSLAPGTERFQAPELELGRPATWQTDRWSLAVLIHVLIARRHPQHACCLEPDPWSRTWDDEGRRRILAAFGHGSVHEGFSRAFLGAPEDRPSALAWRQVLGHALGEMYDCPECGEDFVAASPAEAAARRCACAP